MIQKTGVYTSVAKVTKDIDTSLYIILYIVEKAASSCVIDDSVSMFFCQQTLLSLPLLATVSSSSLLLLKLFKVDLMWTDLHLANKLSCDMRI